MSTKIARQQLLAFLKKKDPGLKDAGVQKKSQAKRRKKKKQKKAEDPEQKRKGIAEANLKYYQQTQETDDKTIETVTQALEAVKKGVRVERPPVSDEDSSDIEATDFNKARHRHL
ncbi:hypothetical protein BSKO_11210 [Bryopsis sp. KO-2023]|nr:hypothetical protein BSKO_11210 [Bryopsis sp. KO-2023]